MFSKGCTCFISSEACCWQSEETTTLQWISEGCHLLLEGCHLLSRGLLLLLPVSRNSSPPKDLRRSPPEVGQQHGPSQTQCLNMDSQSLQVLSLRGLALQQLLSMITTWKCVNQGGKWYSDQDLASPYLALTGCWVISGGIQCSMQSLQDWCIGCVHFYDAHTVSYNSFFSNSWFIWQDQKYSPDV